MDGKFASLKEGSLRRGGGDLGQLSPQRFSFPKEEESGVFRSSSVGR